MLPKKMPRCLAAKVDSRRAAVNWSPHSSCFCSQIAESLLSVIKEAERRNSDYATEVRVPNAGVYRPALSP